MWKRYSRDQHHACVLVVAVGLLGVPRLSLGRFESAISHLVIPVVGVYPVVLSEELPGIPPVREIDLLWS